MTKLTSAGGGWRLFEKRRRLTCTTGRGRRAIGRVEHAPQFGGVGSNTVQPRAFRAHVLRRQEEAWVDRPELSLLRDAAKPAAES